MLRARAGDALVGIYLNELPALMTADVVGIKVDLRFIAGELFLVVGGNTRIRRYPALSLFRDRHSGEAA